MAKKKISELTALTALAAGNIIPIVDSGETKGITITNLFATVPVPILLPDGSAVAPSLANVNRINQGIFFDATNIYFAMAGDWRAKVQSDGAFLMNYLRLGSGATMLYEDAANTLAHKNGNNDQHMRIYGANGTYRDEGAISELLTIAAAASSTTTMSIPVNAIVYGVSVRVTTVIPTAATFTVIGNTSTTAFNTAAVSTAVDSTDVGTQNCPYKNGAAQTIRITPDLTPADNTGRVRITLHYYFIQAATS